MHNPDISREQHDVLFNKATEAPFSGTLLHENRDGSYRCANCHSMLFDSGAKYETACGWPSFDKAHKGSITYYQDPSHGMSRTEVTCAKCGGHLGHVFDDGPRETTGQRYCINSLSLHFEPKK